MKEEFDLSKQINPSLSSKVSEGWIFEGDVKKFIKLIEEAVLSKGRRALVDIRKLAGDKLIEGEK